MSSPTGNVALFEWQCYKCIYIEMCYLFQRIRAVLPNYIIFWNYKQCFVLSWITTKKTITFLLIYTPVAFLEKLLLFCIKTTTIFSLICKVEQSYKLRWLLKDKSFLTSIHPVFSESEIIFLLLSDYSNHLCPSGCNSESMKGIITS